VSAAATLFRDRGYHQVAMADVAGAVGVTPRALYRHVSGKQDLLARAVLGGIDTIEAAVAPAETGGDTLAAVLPRLATAAWTERGIAVLVDREARHLEGPARSAFQRRTAVIRTTLRDHLRADRADLTNESAAILVRAALAVMASPSYHGVAVAAPHAEEMLTSMAAAVLAAPVSGAAEPGQPSGEAATPGGPASRREQVLMLAIALFARDGYGAARIEDIGAAAGIAGPSIYEHFSSKSDLLLAALTRGAEWLQYGMVTAREGSPDPAAVVDRMLRSYVDFMLSHRDLMRVFLTETVNLPDDDRRTLRRLQHQYVTEWVDAITTHQPTISQSDARFLAHGALGIINDYAMRGGAVSEALAPTLVDLAGRALAAMVA
jgi:AcrR family transcriptional regulator